MSKPLPATATPMLVSARRVLITCACGTLPLADASQPTPTAAWRVAAAHVALTGKCTPAMTWVNSPAVRVA